MLKPFVTYIQQVNEKSKGDITINWAGGSDVIPAFDQGGAVKDGVVDMAVLPTSYFSQLNAAVFGTAIQSQYTPMEEYTNGVYDFMNSESNKVNLRFVGRIETNMTFHIGVKKPFTSYKELAGKKIRDAVLFSSFLKALGCVPVTVAPTEVYNSLDRGVVDGYNFPYTDVADFSIFEVCKYFMDQNVYEAGNLVIIMNNKSFNSLFQGQTGCLNQYLERLHAHHLCYDGRYSGCRQEEDDRRRYAAYQIIGCRSQGFPRPGLLLICRWYQSPGPGGYLHQNYANRQEIIDFLNYT